ncbi:MAG: DUF6055 domain-containing protein [Chthoniobacter sp.]|nr:DUF6055 domain-containing protein [Chthoniobacter sp.]
MKSSLLSLFFSLVLPLAASALPVVVDPATPLTGTYAVEWNTNGNLESWTTSQVTGATVSGGQFSGTTSGTAPQVIRSNFSGPDLDLGFNDYLEIRIQVPASHTGDIKISYGTTSTTGFSTARVLIIPDALVPTDGAFHTYRIDVGPEPWWRATLRDLRIEPSATSGQAFAIDYLRVGDLPGDVYLTNSEWNSDNEMSSKHFRFIWDANRASQGVNTTTARGSLRNAEEAWQVYVKMMGYREPAESKYSPNGSKYKVNFLCIYNGYYMSSTGGGFGYMNIEPSGLQVDPPTWIIPHELMHVFQFHNDNGNYSGQWETHANYGRARWLKHYQNLYPNSAGIEALGVRDGHFMISSGRNYYLTWPFLYYVDDNPDNLPDLSDGMIKRLWQEGQSGEFWATTLDRLTPTTSLKDISGYYARRCATWNFSNKAAMNAELNTQDPTRNARHLFTDLIQRADGPGWWRVSPEKAPAQGAYAMHELIPAGTGAGRVVTVNLQGLADSARGADWRASFVAISDAGVERYTPLWSNGSSSITLAANENKLYLSVAGTPDWYANGGHDESIEHFRSHPSRSRFHYQLQVTGATPLERNNGATTGLTQHSNGGGYKSVTVPASVYIGPNARVTGGSVSGNARIEDYAVVAGGTVNGSAVISGHAWVRGGTVTGYARVRDWAIVDSGTISGNARVLDHATVEGNLQDTAVAKGSAWHQSGGTLSGNAIVDGDYMFNKSLSGGITFGHLPYVGIPDNFTTATPTGLYAAYDFGTAHDSRALDQYGVTDAFTIGSPAWTSTDWKRKGFLTFNGSTQYIALDRSVADTRAFTFAAWVKPAGGAANQAVLWLGAGTTRRMSFTASDASGQAKFAIVNGGAEQTLTTAALPVGVWSHVAVALDGTTGTLFINGTAAATGSITITPDQLLAANTTTGTQHNYLARSEGSAMPMFQGSLDDAQFFSAALSAAQLATVTVPLAGDVMLSDNFNSASGGASVFNSTLSADQQGLLAPTAYTVAGNNADYKIQHGNGGQMLMAGWFGGESLNLYASLNHNFADEANALNKPLKVQFDLKVTDSPDASNWAAFAIGSAQNAFVNNAANKLSSLFRHSGGTQQFASGGDTSSGISWAAAGSTIAVILSDTAGNGSPFNGNGSVARFYVNGTLAGTYTLAQMAATDGYISFEAYGVMANYDNLSISVVSTPSSNFYWNNSAGTFAWNTTDANWTGANWSNSTGNNAFFTTSGGALTLGTLAAGAVSVGSASINFPATTFSGGSLGASTLTVQGSGSNNGAYASNPTLTVNSAIALSGDAALGRASLSITGGTFSASRIISNAASADWARLAISGGTVTTTSGVDGSVNTGATFQLELNGGTLEVPSLRVANRDLNAAGPDSNNDANLIWNGGALRAIGADNADFITLYGDGSNGTNPAQATYVQSGGAIIDTNGRNIGIQVKLLTAGGSGGLTKTGAGTLTLTGANTYTGTTTVSAGTLLVNGSIATSATTVQSGATLGGTGSAGNVTLNSGATLAPGTGGIGTFTAANVTLSGTLAVEISAVTTDRLNASGNVALSGPLTISAAAGIAPGTSFTILSKTSAGAVSGTFAGLPQGSAFSASGYLWIISYTGGDGNDVTLTPATAQQSWRFTHFGTMANTGTAADTFDANNDGESNLLEFATGQNPNAATSVATSIVKNGATLEFTYTRSNAALADGATFTAEWRDDLSSGAWSNTGITEQILTDDGTMQTVKASVAAGTFRRFLHLKILKP